MKKLIHFTSLTLFLVTISYAQEKDLKNSFSVAISLHPGELDYKKDIYKRDNLDYDVEMLFQRFGFNVTLSAYR